MRAGAVGYVVKTPAHSGLLKAIQDVLDGEVHMSARLARRIFQTLSGPPEIISSEEPPLTKREREILEALGKGDSPRQVATALFVDYETIRSHLRHIYAKLEVHSRYEAVAVFRARTS
jgi:DNA-binding NarL/FixJ family response regulator